MNTTMCLPRLTPGLLVADAKITCHYLGRPRRTRPLSV